MSVKTFIPNVWVAQLLMPYEKSLVYTQPGVVNRDYEGEIAAYGDRVTINTISDVTIRTYDNTTTLSAAQDVQTASQEMIIDQGNYFRFVVKDVDAVQARGDFGGAQLERAAYKMGDTADQWMAALMAAAVPSANTIGTTASPKTDLGTAGNAYDYLVDLGTKLDEANVPSEGRWAIVPPWFHARLTKSGEDFIHATDMGDGVLRNGMIGMAAGFMVFKSNNVPNATATTKFKIIAGVDYATSFATQLIETEAYRSHDYFGDEVRGLQVYGGKVVYPEALAMLIANKPS